MADRTSTRGFLARLLGAGGARPILPAAAPGRPQGDPLPLPEYAESGAAPVPLTRVLQADGRLSQYPPPDRWGDWVEYDGKAWPQRVARRYTLVPTICFNCESACGLLAYVDRETLEVRKFEGNPAHPGSRGRNCAKGPATHNQTYDPERILHPLKRAGARGGGKWVRVSWEEALRDIGGRMRESRRRRRDGIVYHVGRPGEDHFANRTVTAWGVDGHNSHTNICSSSARTGYVLWSGSDRPSPDYAHARTTLLVSSHLEAGHYFNPHAQRIIEGKRDGARLVVLDPRLSNTASRADVWLPTWPGSETTVLLAFANHLLETGRYDRGFLRRWVNWEETLATAAEWAEGEEPRAVAAEAARSAAEGGWRFEDFERLLKALYRPFTPERAAAEARVPADRIREAAECVAAAGDRLSAHVWRAAATGNLGGWQVARALFLLNVLTGSVGTRGGTSLHTWNKFVPVPFSSPPAGEAWNELLMPLEWPLSMFEMSFLLPHFLEEGRGTLDVYFTRVYNPVWTNPDGFQWIRALKDESRIGLHVALTPTWSETAWFADYVLPMGHGGERHDLMSQETHSGRWIGFRQPVRRVAMERAGRRVARTRDANPGEVWEESEFWVDLAFAMDPDGSLGVRRWFESPARPGEPITMDEYFGHIFEKSVPGLPEAAAKEGLTPLAYMRKYGAFEVSKDDYSLHERAAAPGKGIEVDGERRAGFTTPSGRLEFMSPTLRAWGWGEQRHCIPWPLESHVHPGRIDAAKGEMLLLPNFRLPTLIHTRSANSKWLYEISHRNPVWIHPSDADRIGARTGDLLRVTTEIGWFVDRAWVTEGIKPGIVAVSHHLGRWRLRDGDGIGAGMSSLVALDAEAERRTLDVLRGGGPWESPDPDTSRIWWEDVGVHQNLTHGVHPDPVSGGHCWHQKARNVERAHPGDRLGDVRVDGRRSMEVYREWLALARPARAHSPDGTRRPHWLPRPLKPAASAYRLPPLPGSPS
ncbi:MAG: molybdopterin-dependent oxidoreductase [Planctomycetes bacterium]|nr:molybdopterin-dependent oxidoreductase [Planctomycetota bacterium]